jgi:guanine deaminase
MATLGGASLCNLDKRIGSFEVGKEFDALRVNPHMGRISGEFDQKKLGESFERWIWAGDDRDLKDVWVRGRRVAGNV